MFWENDEGEQREFSFLTFLKIFESFYFSLEEKIYTLLKISATKKENFICLKFQFNPVRLKNKNFKAAFNEYLIILYDLIFM